MHQRATNAQAARKIAQKTTKFASSPGSMAPNGEVEGPPRSANQAPWAHTAFPRPRRVTTYRSRTLQRLLGGPKRSADLPLPCGQLTYEVRL